ncbi:MAG: hypothetical protein NVS4B2_25210 [Chloroflexota bacterium]
MSLADAELKGQDELYRGVFESAADGLTVTNHEGQIVDANPSACRMYGYTRDEMVRLSAAALVHRDDHPLLAQTISAAQAGRSTRGEFTALRKDGSVFRAEGWATALVYRGETHYLGWTRDITDRVRAYELLERRVEERTRELSAVLEVAHNVASTLELQPLLDLILDQLQSVVENNGAALLKRQDDMVFVLSRRSPGPDAQAAPTSYTSERIAPLLETLLRGEPIIVDDVRGNSPMAVAYRAAVGDSLDTAFQYERGWMVVPMKIKERVVGGLSLSSDRPGFFTPRHAELATAIASHAALAIENASLYEQTVQRTQELSTLLDVSHTVASTLELQPLLDLILDQLQLVVDYTGAGISLQEDDDVVRIIAYQGPGPEALALGSRFSISEAGPLWNEMRRHEPLIIKDIRDETPEAQGYREVIGDLLDTSFSYIRSWMSIPMRVKDRYIGSLFLEHSQPNVYSAHHANLALAMAQQAAIAIENARLYEKAQTLAALEERQRLARELHDSVTQALHGIGLAAETTRLLLEQNPDRAVKSNQTVQYLARSGMAEMRALLFELRPESLQLEGLVAALKKQTNALAARHDIPIEIDLCAEPSVSLPVKEALYRIAQEALHNAFKHAQPTQVALRLCFPRGEIELTVWDNGAGFDTSASFPGHLGLRSMQERAKNVGGVLAIHSGPGQGTRIRATIPVADDRPSP